MSSFDNSIEKIRHDMDAVKTASNIVMESWDDSVSRSLDNKVVGEIQRVSISSLEEMECLIRSVKEKKEEIDYSQQSIDEYYENMISLLSQIEAYVQLENNKTITLYDSQHHITGYAKRRGNGVTEFTDSEHHTVGYAKNKGTGVTEFTDSEHHTKGYAKNKGTGVTEFTDSEHHTKGYAKNKGTGVTEFTDSEHHTEGYAKKMSNGKTEYTDRNHHVTGKSSS